MKISGNDLKRALRANEITQQVAAEKLGISRQWLHIQLKLDNVDESVVHNVKEKLGIDLTSVAPRYTPRTESEPYYLAQDVKRPVLNNDKWTNPDLSFVENVEKLIAFHKEGYLTKEQLQKIIARMVDMDY